MNALVDGNGNTQISDGVLKNMQWLRNNDIVDLNWSNADQYIKIENTKKNSKQIDDTMNLKLLKLKKMLKQ